jgi:hypothetical protein
VVVIGPSLLAPNPFDADPSSPIVILNSILGPLKPAAVDDLQRVQSVSNIRLATRGGNST